MIQRSTSCKEESERAKKSKGKKIESQEIYDLSLDKWHDRTTSIWSSLPNGSPITLMDHENE